MVDAGSELLEIRPGLIDPNPDNPRLVFRESELNFLTASIRKVGIKVPLSVYREGKRFVLIDGERRLRSAKKLNLQSVPALVQPKPGPLENLLTMFNIHNVRVDWDLMPMALKLAQIRDMLQADGKSATGPDLAGLTGVPLATVRRAFDLLALPKRYQDELLKEAEKPRDQQVIKADLFVEITKTQRVIERYLPDVMAQIGTEPFIDAMVEKYRSGVVDSVVTYRDISKIARAERAGADKALAGPAILRLVERPRLSIEEAFEQTVQRDYFARDLATRTITLVDRLRGVNSLAELSADAKQALSSLKSELDRLFPPS